MKRSLQNGVTVDPIRHIQGVAKLLGFYDQLIYEKLRGSTGSFAHIGTFSEREWKKGDCLDVYLLYRPTNEVERHVWYEYLRGDKGAVKGKWFSQIDLRLDDLSSFGEFKEGIHLAVSVYNSKIYLDCQIAQTNGIFRLQRRNMRKELRDSFGSDELVEMHGRDYRAYVHRLLEVYAGVPRKEWHKPERYLEKDPQAKQQEKEEKTLTTLIDQAIIILFSGSEKETLLERMHKARIKGRKSWPSVPKLNLGSTDLPCRGIKDIRGDEFVTTAVPYLIEQLAQLGIMNPEEAEAVVVQRLTNYFIHSGGFQLSEARARELIQRLQPVRSESEVELKRTTL